MPEIEKAGEPERRLITSEELSKKAVAACWTFAVVLLGSGITATFIADGGAAAASMILLGTLLLVIALMGRVPLRLEVGGAVLDASYPPDDAYQAGREGGVAEGIDEAIEQIEGATSDADDRAVELLRRWRDRTMTGVNTFELKGRIADELQQPLDIEVLVDSGGLGYSPTEVCSAAAITYRQLDYWTRTGLATPSVRQARDNVPNSLFSRKDIITIKLTKSLLDAGISLREIRNVVSLLKETHVEDIQPVTILSDGSSVFVSRSNDEILDLLSSSQAMFGVSLSAVARDVDAALMQLPPPHR